MRWAIVGLATACALGVGMLLYGRIATTTRDDARDWRQSELAFLKSVHDRIQVDLAFQSAGGAASLRREDDTILRAMAAVAKQMPADSVPNDIRVLLPASDLPEEDAQAAPFEEARGGGGSLAVATERDDLGGLGCRSGDDVAELDVDGPGDAHGRELRVLADVEEERAGVLAVARSGWCDLFDGSQWKTCGAPCVDAAVEERKVVIADPVCEAGGLLAVFVGDEQYDGRVERHDPAEP